MKTLVLRCAILATLLGGVAAHAQRAIAPTARTYFSATPVPFEQALLALEKEKKVEATAAVTKEAATTPPEIVELARALKNDPDLIYQYVHDNIEFSPLYGVLKGPVGTLLDGRGDSFDQAALMVALLQQASLTNTAISNVLFEFGQVYLSSAQLQSWLNVDSNPYSIGSILASAGIPASLYSDGSAILGHVWVKVNINGTPYVFDPAFKPHTWAVGIVASLPTIMGYTQSKFLTDANATVTSTTIKGVNRTQLRTDLTSYATKLAAYIRSSEPRAGVNDILGGGTIVPTPIVNGQTLRQTTNPNQYGTVTDWTSIPSSYYATLSITLPGAATQTYNSDDIYGRRLSIFFNASYVPTLYLDGAAVVSGSASSQGAQVGVDFSISIPWATFANQSRTQYISAETNQNGGNGGYVVETGWDQVGRGMIEKHRALLQQAMKSGAASNSEVVLGETLSVLGYTWLAEAAAQQHITDQLLGTATQYFYGGGIVGEAVGTTVSSPYVDLPLNFINTPARVNGAQTQTANSLAAFLDSSGTSSSFESATLEQTQAKVPGFVAASTVKLLDTAIENGDTLFDINNGNTSATQQYYTSVIEPQLAPNYNAGDLATISNYVAQGFRVIAPLHGQIAVGAWTGVGFKSLYADSGGGFSYGEIISGGLSGGFGGVNDPTGGLDGNTAGSGDPGSNSPGSNAPGGSSSGNGTGNVGDPIDHRKGSLQYENIDLAIGAKSFPYGLNFERSYDSGAQASAGPLGNGWTHNYAITATVGSDGFTSMGQGSPLNAVSSIVALYVSSDLMKGEALEGQANLENFTVETVVNRWFTDQLTQNVVYVNQGWSSEEFTKEADGTYGPPVGSATILDAPGGDFRYRTKSGITMSFNAAGQISTWTNAAGASISFTYAGGLLSTIKNAATGRQLTLAYSGSVISTVSDGSRTVEYGYSNGNLISFTDPLGQKTTFAYDTSGTEDTGGHLTQVFYPSNPTNPFVTTYYDSAGKVSQQKDALGNLTQTFFAGARTEVDDPVGNRHVWYNDPRGNVTLEIQDYGASPHLNISTANSYDGQSNLLKTTLPEGDANSYTYDALFNPLTITQTAKPGSTLSPLVKSFTYTVPVAALANFEEVHTSTDPNKNVTTFSYNATTGTLAKIVQPAVTKPGVGTSTPQQMFTYTAIGLPQTAQDAEGRITQYAYDATYADEVDQLTIDYGRLNLVTKYGHDAYGDVTSVTDANGHVTTSIFDKLRRLTEMDGAVAGVVTKYTYHPDGPMATMARQVTTGTYETTTYSYTLSDKVHVVTDPLGNTVTTTYDADDRKLTVTSQVSATQNRQRTYSYDALSRLYQIRDTTAGTPGTALETHTYSPNSNQLSFSDANSHATSYVYDGFDRLSTTTYPDKGTEKYTYDADGNVLQKTVRSGQTISFTYDALNRVATKTPTGEAAGKVTYGYDLTGRTLQALDGSSATPYQVAYDTAGRANSFTDQQGRNTQAVYDGVGNRTRLQWPANTSGTSAYYVTYTFDALNRMTEIDAKGSTATPLAKYQWDALSRQTLITYGDSTSDSYKQYDAANNLLALTETFTGGTSVTFSYGWFKDHRRQSTALNNSAFQYVPVSGTTSYGSANVDNGYTTVGAASLTYDTNQNLTYDGFNTLTYDVENRLIQAKNATAGTSQYFYDPLGHRKEKVVGTVTTQFVLIGNEEIADFSGTGVGTAQSLTVRGVGGLPVAAITPATGVAVYYHHDALGSTVAVTQAGTAGAADLYTYGEFGATGAGNWATYRFAGYRYDAETGLYYVNARYYSPKLGRFLQTDPIGYAGGRNLYGYVDNNPLNVRDPLGTCGNPQGCGFWNSLFGWAEDNPVLAVLGAAVVIGVAVTAAVLLAPEIAALFAGEEVAAAATSVFWSGGAQAQAAATEFALANGGVTIGMTEAGQALTALTEGMDWALARPLWNALSAEFAAAASGDITAFISSTASANSIFFTTELGILLENEAVTSLTLIFL